MTDPAIQAEDLSKNFKQGDEIVHALKPLDLCIGRGEFVAIVGPSGSGKSTLLTLLGGLQKPSTGRVLVGGRDITATKDRDRVRLRLESIGFILQSSNLVPFLTVDQQLELFDKAVGRGRRSRASTGDALTPSPVSTAQAHRQILDSLGIGKLAGKYPAQISGGEQQRAAIARALYAQPSVILADEPTAALDTRRAFEVVDLLGQQARQRNTAIIMVTHDERLTDRVDRVIRCEDGVAREE